MKLLNLGDINKAKYGIGSYKQPDKEEEAATCRDLYFCTMCGSTHINIANDGVQFCPHCGAKDRMVLINEGGRSEYNQTDRHLIAAFKNFSGDSVVGIYEYRFESSGLNDGYIPDHLRDALKRNPNKFVDGDASVTFMQTYKTAINTKYTCSADENTDKIVIKRSDFDYSRLKAVFNISENDLSFWVAFALISVESADPIEDQLAQVVYNRRGIDNGYSYEDFGLNVLGYIDTDSCSEGEIDVTNSNELKYIYDKDKGSAFKYYFDLFKELGIDVYIDNPKAYSDLVKRAEAVLEFNKYLEENEPETALRLKMDEDVSCIRKAKVNND